MVGSVLHIWVLPFPSSSLLRKSYRLISYTNAYGVYNDFYVREYLSPKYTSSQISWIGSVQLLLVLSGGLLSGRGFDAGYFYHLTIGGVTLFVFCLFMLSISQAGQYYQVFLAQGLGMGIAIGITYVPCLAIISHYFMRRRSLALGIASSGSAIGGAIQPIMLNSWFHGSLGFHQGVRASAAFNAALLIIAICLMRPRLPPKPDGGSPFRSLRIFIVDVPYMIVVLGTTLSTAGSYFPIFFLQLNAVLNGIEANLAFYTLTILNAASALGRIVPNLFAYRFGVFNAIIPSTAATGVLIFCLLAVHNVAGTFVFAVLYGFCSGAQIGLIAPMVASLSKQDEVGARLGICFFYTGFGGLIGSPIAGALLSSSFIWWRPILFSGLCVLAGSLSFGITRIFVARRKQTQWV
ncbi:major facilitator superfamily domain-containing protein [Infundibulicybe gibba]|nr:major facilitator superfamily domain-containing protein [Infundibulicybe gibba]